MLRVTALWLVLCFCSASAGESRLFDGTIVNSDSIAILKLFSEIGRINRPTTIFVFASKIDSVRLYDATYSGEDFWGAYRSIHGKRIDDLLTDFGVAERVNKANLDCKSHIITVQCVLRYNRKRNGEFGSSGPAQLVFSPEPGHKYELRATCQGVLWTIWIADQKTKQVVSQPAQ